VYPEDCNWGDEEKDGVLREEEKEAERCQSNLLLPPAAWPGGDVVVSSNGKQSGGVEHRLSPYSLLTHPTC